MSRTGWVAPALAAAAVFALATCAVLGLSSPDGSPVELAMASTAPAVATQPATFQAPATRAKLIGLPGNMGVGRAGTAGTPNTPAQAAATPATPATQATAPTPITPAVKKVKLSQAIQMTEDSANKALARASRQAVQAALLQAALSVPGQRTAEKAAAKRAAAAAANKPSAAFLAGERALGNRDPYEPVVQKSVDASAKLAAKRRLAASRLRALKLGRSGSMALAGQHDEEEHAEEGHAEEGGQHEEDEEEVERKREEEEDKAREDEEKHKLPYKIVKGHHRDDAYVKYHEDEEDGKDEEEEEHKYVQGTRQLGTPVKEDDVKDEWMEGAHNPGFFIHPRDRYVKVGGIIHPPSEEEEEEEDADEDAEQRENDEEGREGGGAGDNEEAHAREERARATQQLSAGGSLNSPNAPTLEGGVSVPGGRVVWLPLNSLSSSGPGSAPAPAPAAPQPIPMPQMPAMYSKVVAYGPDGKPDAVWYGSGQWLPEGGSARTMASRGRQQQLSMAEGGGRREAKGADGLTADDRKIERKVLFHLLKEEAMAGGGAASAGASTGVSLVLPLAMLLVLGVTRGGWW